MANPAAPPIAAPISAPSVRPVMRYPAMPPIIAPRPSGYQLAVAVTDAQPNADMESAMMRIMLISFFITISPYLTKSVINAHALPVRPTTFRAIFHVFYIIRPTIEYDNTSCATLDVHPEPARSLLRRAISTPFFSGVDASTLAIIGVWACTSFFIAGEEVFGGCADTRECGRPCCTRPCREIFRLSGLFSLNSSLYQPSSQNLVHDIRAARQRGWNTLINRVLWMLLVYA